jgi:hypothetical protein
VLRTKTENADISTSSRGKTRLIFELQKHYLPIAPSPESV